MFWITLVYQTLNYAFVLETIVWEYKYLGT